MPQLSQWWNTGAVISELISSFLLILLALSVNLFFGKKAEESKFYKYIVLPFLYSIIGLIALYAGFWGGNAYEDMSATALMSLPMTIIKSVYFDAYNFFITATMMQIVGSLIGALAFMLVSKITFKVRRTSNDSPRNYLFISNVINKQFVIKESLSQLAFVGALFTFGLFSYGFGVSGNFYISVMLTTIVLVFTFLFTMNYYNFLLSPQLIFSCLVVGHFYKVTTWKHWRTFFVAVLIQASVAIILSFPEQAIRTR